MAKELSNEELRNISVEELGSRLIAARKALFDLRLKRAEVKNPLEIRWKRREIARILTIIKEKERSGKSGTGK